MEKDSKQLEVAANKRIAKNAIFLYIRMFLIMAISLYTSRAILKILGAEDFGLFNVVAGVVAMLSFVNTTLTSASSRFITFSLGTKNNDDLNKTFNTILLIHILFVGLIVLLAETVGLWFVKTKLVIPIERMDAAVWTYQCSVITASLMFLYAPFNALIIANEKMTAFAYVSILEKLMQLVAILIIVDLSYDKLIAYSTFLLLSQIIVLSIYITYCIRKFSSIKYAIYFEKERIKKIFSYAGWVLSGNLAFLGYTQGLNILLNIFFGPIVNAARGLSVQVQGTILNFTSNFQTSVNPQIIKSYAQSDFNRMHQLVLISSRMSFYLMMIVVVPLFIHVDYVLTLWLGDVPEYTANFVRVMLLIGLNSTFKNPTLTAIHATGDIKKFQIIESSLLLMIIPLAWFCVKYYNYNPIQVILIYLVIELITQFIRVWIVYPKIHLSFSLYLKKVIYPCSLVLLIVYGIAYYASLSYQVDHFLELFLFVIVNTIISLTIVYTVGISRKERNNFNVIACRLITKYIKKA